MVSITRILCPIDFSDGSRLALEYAVAIARWYGARVTAVHVFPNVPIADPFPTFGGQALMLTDRDVDALRDQLTGYVAAFAGDQFVATELIEGTDVRGKILERADAIAADLIVMGTHGRGGFEHLLLGSVAEKVVRTASCPVMLVPPRAQRHLKPLAVPFTRILFATDFAPTAQRALDMAIELAEEADAHLTLLHAIEVPPELQVHAPSGDIDVSALRLAAEARALEQLRALVPEEARVYCKVQTDVREGRPYRSILQAEADTQADLIVMGVHGGNALDRLVFGSNTHAVLRGASCPVLAVRTVTAPVKTAIADPSEHVHRH
jgi:nucleotide-binding universal stress UspA family protein